MSNPDDSKKDNISMPQDKVEDKKEETSLEAGEEKKEGTVSDQAPLENDDFAAKQESDNLFEDEENAKKTSSFLIPFIFLIFLCGAFLVFGYVYNIAGLRNKVDAYNLEQIPNYMSESTDDIISTVVEDKSDVTDGIAAEGISKAVTDNTEAEVISETAEAVEETEEENMLQNIMTQLDNTQDEVIEEEPVSKASQEEEQDVMVEPVIQTVTEYVPAYALSKEEFIDHKEKIRALNKAIYSGKTYINELVAVKSLFPDLELSLMTEYSAVGKPNKFSTAQDGVQAVKRAAILQDVKTDAGVQDILNAVIRKFVVITPVENINENDLDGQLSLIKNAFTNGDFKAALKHIKGLPEDRAKEFEPVVNIIQDVYGLKDEMRQIDTALTEKLYNNKNN